MAGSGVVLFVALLVPILSQSIPPGTPFIEGPTYIVVGEQITLTCTSTGGNPSPTVKWFEGPTMIDDSYEQNGIRVVNEYTFTAEKRHNLIVFECQVDNEVLQNPLTSTWFFQVYTPPNQPTITGPTDIIDGTSSTHVCVSTGGNPSPVMTMRIGQTTLTAADGLIETTEFLQADFSYTVTQTITWNPTLANNGQTMFCQVDHDETRANNPQIVSLQLTVRVACLLMHPQLQYNPTIGNNLVLQCIVTGTATSVTWRKDNSQLFINNNGRYSNGNTSSDSGQYVCSASDGSKTVVLMSLQSVCSIFTNCDNSVLNLHRPVWKLCNTCMYSVAVPFQNKCLCGEGCFAQINSGDNGYSGSTTNNPSLTINSVTTMTRNIQMLCYKYCRNGQSSTTQLTVSGGNVDL
ncbi:Hypothetical predicted protein [Mytilus galloprovincialis]|uniref:Ig-like domain-containing protein n=1 Tax=Mytilus galloprovincialis TaxID=29158 RepID=A0A8B6EE65_MYTGA|nr:Hypothetical predicted protein [Mytilus galloprovincialis]